MFLMLDLMSVSLIISKAETLIGTMTFNYHNDSPLSQQLGLHSLLGAVYPAK